MACQAPNYQFTSILAAEAPVIQVGSGIRLEFDIGNRDALLLAELSACVLIHSNFHSNPLARHAAAPALGSAIAKTVFQEENMQDEVGPNCWTTS